MKKVPIQIGDGCAVAEDIAYVAAFPDELGDDRPFTRLFALNAATHEKWFHQDWPDNRAVSVCLVSATSNSSRAVCALSDEGSVRLANSAGVQLETIPGAGLSAVGSRGLGALRRVREIAGALYAVGIGNQVYVRSREGWIAIDGVLTEGSAKNQEDLTSRLRGVSGQISEAELLSLTTEISGIGGFDDVGGSAANDLYVCGLGGSIWHWDGLAWCRVPSHTDEHLHALHVVSSEEVLLCGHNGTLLRGNAKQGFVSLTGADVSDHFWSVRKFGSNIYVGTTRGLFQVEGNQVAPVRLPRKKQGFVVQAIDSFANTLWLIADRFVARLVNSEWEVFEHPDNS